MGTQGEDPPWPQEGHTGLAGSRQGGLGDGEGHCSLWLPVKESGGPETGEAGTLKRPRKGVETRSLRTSRRKRSPLGVH